jgi:hypothetical protein
MHLKRAVITKVKILDAKVVRAQADQVVDEDLEVKIVVRVAKVVMQADLAAAEVLVDKIEVKVVKDMVNAAMRIAKQAFTMAVDLPAVLAGISHVQVRDLAKKALVKAHLEVVLAKIGALAVSQLQNMPRNSRKAN